MHSASSASTPFLGQVGSRGGATILGQYGDMPPSGPIEVFVTSDVDQVDWKQAKKDLADDDFDNGRSAATLRLSFEQSQHVAFAWIGRRLVGMARMLSDGVCNSYLLDVWTASSVRRRGVASKMVEYLLERVPGEHVGLQTDDAVEFYRSLGFQAQPHFMSLVVGEWLGNTANRKDTDPFATS